MAVMGEQLLCEQKPALNAGGGLICYGGKKGFWLHHCPSSSEYCSTQLGG